MKTKSLRTKMISIVLITVLLVSVLKAQQTMDVADFTGIKSSASFDIIISQSAVNTITLDEKATKNNPLTKSPFNTTTEVLVKTEVKDGILIITDDGNTTDKTVRIGVKSLNSLNISGSGDVITDNQLTGDKFIIETSGAGNAHLNIKAAEINAQISGSGDVILKGAAQLLEANVSGAGDLKASNLEVDKVKIEVSGSGDGKVNVQQTLDANVSGAGDIIYKGKPIDRIINISGSGSIRESKSGNGEETSSDTTKLKLGKKKYVIIGDDDDDDDEDDEVLSKKDSIKKFDEGFRHWTGIEIGINGLLDYNNTLEVPEGADFLELNYTKSIHFGLNLMEKNFHIYKNYLNLVAGFGFDFKHYALKNNVTLNSDAVYLEASSDLLKYKKNTLNISYIKAPLMLEFNSSENTINNFHIAVGAQFEYRIHSVLKQKYNSDDKHYKIKQKDDFNLEPFIYTATARVGYNNITLFANYGLNRLFKKDGAPQVYPFTVGINFNI